MDRMSNSPRLGLLSMLLLTTGFFAALMAAPAAAQNVMGDVTGNTGVIAQYPGQCLGTNCTLTATPPVLFQLGPSCLTVQPGISLCSDGKVTVPAGMKMDAAARQFVDELRRYWPTVCGLKK